MTAIWRIELFGGLRGQSVDGAQFGPGVSRAGALFACLALAPGRSQTRDYAATLLWPEADDAAGRARLRHELSVLRRQLEPDGISEGSVLSRERDRISLVEGAVLTDVEQFLAALTLARENKEPSEREQHLGDAAAFYRGRLLPGYDYEGLELERADLSHKYETALRELASVRQQLGNISGAETSLRTLIACNPYLEEAYTDLMRLYAVQGQTTRVREQYKQLEHMLRSEFDAAPSEPARLLMESLSRKDANTNQASARVSLVVPATVSDSPDPVIASSGLNSTSPLANTTNGGRLSSSTAMPARRITSRSKSIPWGSAAAALALITILAVAGFQRASHHRVKNPARTAPTSGSAIAGGVRWTDPTWVYAYTSQRGEKANSDPRAAQIVGDDLFVTGFVQTESEDTDMLTLKISPEGKLLGRDRYSGPAHDCDRAFSIAADPQGGVYVAGESYVPAKTGVAEGWRIVVIQYDGNLKRIWTKQSPMTTKEAGDGDIQVLATDKGGCLVGGTALVNGIPHLLVLRYDSAGQLLWSRTISQESTFGRLATWKDIIYACGTKYRRDSLGQHSEWIAVRFGNDGKPLWERAIVGPGLGGMANDIKPEETELFVVGKFHLPASGPGGPGITLGAAGMKADTGQLVWTKWLPQGYLDVNCGGSTIGDHGVLVTGQCTLPSSDLRVESVRYSAEGDQLWESQISAPTGFRTVIGSGNHSGGVLGLAAMKVSTDVLLGGDLLVTDEQGHGYDGGAPLAMRPLGADGNLPHAIQMIDANHGYIISQTQLRSGPTLTVTKFQR